MSGEAAGLQPPTGSPDGGLPCIHAPAWEQGQGAGSTPPPRPHTAQPTYVTRVHVSRVDGWQALGLGRVGAGRRERKLLELRQRAGEQAAPAPPTVRRLRAGRLPAGRLLLVLLLLAQERLGLLLEVLLLRGLRRRRRLLLLLQVVLLEHGMLQLQGDVLGGGLRHLEVGRGRVGLLQADGGVCLRQRTAVCCAVVGVGGCALTWAWGGQRGRTVGEGV